MGANTSLLAYGHLANLMTKTVIIFIPVRKCWCGLAPFDHSKGAKSPQVYDYSLSGVTELAGGIKPLTAPRNGRMDLIMP
ncbi:hypothetical protein GMA19_04865 [Paenibacillus polymyxa E681]|nr:hypothetical protein GE561_04876 [Paenibacillus polymyxa E681]QNV64474.1 hypothetical protein GMA19_04865 [Paenibacillus polymyxa E681]